MKNKVEIKAENEIICPKCGNYDNLHYNFDYSKKDMPILDVLCNECGCVFKLESK